MSTLPRCPTRNNHTVTPQFRRNFRLRVAKNPELAKHYRQSVLAFYEDPELVSAHPLRYEMSGRWSFTVDDDCRVIFRIMDNFYLFVDIGSHSQVYGR